MGKRALVHTVDSAIRLDVWGWLYTDKDIVAADCFACVRIYLSSIEERFNKSSDEHIFNIIIL